ncbi:MAG: ester cyclase [Vicinamibacterales bacterium]
MSEANKALVRGFYDDINRGDVDAFLAKLADDFVEHEAFPGIPPTKQGVGVLFEQLRKAFSGFRMNVEAMAAEGDLVVVRVTMTGSHVGEFMGVPPSGKAVRVPLCDWTRVRDGKAVEHWGITDTSALIA